MIGLFDIIMHTSTIVHRVIPINIMTQIHPPRHLVQASGRIGQTGVN